MMTEGPQTYPTLTQTAAVPIPEYANPRAFNREALPLKLMADLCVEPKIDRRLWLVFGLLVVAAYAGLTFRFWAPADSGVDQNAYLVGGRLIAEHLTPRYELPNPYAYVGGMFVRMTPADQMGGVYYPKYPFGLPLLYAMFFWVNAVTSHLPASWHLSFQPAVAMFLVSPVSSVMAVLGMFFLARLVAGSFAAVLSSIMLGTSQVMLVLSNNPNSHASCVAFIVWGFFLLIRWWQTGSLWRGALAGLFIGFAGTIRYSEVLLAIPVALACLSRVYWSSWRSYLQLIVVAMSLGAALLLIKSLGGDYEGKDIVYAGGLITVALALVPVVAWRGIKPVQLVLLGAAWILTGLGVLAFFKADLSGVKKFVSEVLPLLGTVCLISAIGCAISATWSDWKDFYHRVFPGMLWLVPVLALVLFNQKTMHSWTGYDATNESDFGAAFTWKKFWLTWEEMLRTFYDLGLFWIAPFGVAGLLMLFRRSWLLGLVMLGWLLPGVALYTAYYWSPDRDVAYARFFVSFFPVVILGVAVCFHDGILGGLWRESGEYKPRSWRDWIGLNSSMPLVISAGVVVAIASGVSVYRDIRGLRDGSPGVKMPNEEYRERLSLASTGKILLATVPPKSVLFTDGAGGISAPANYVQSIGDWELYPADAFSLDGSRRGFGGGARNNRGGNNNRGGRGGNRGGFGGGPPGGGGGFGNNQANNDPTAVVATPVQPEQQEYHANLYKNKSTRQLYQMEAQVVNDAIKADHRVFLLVDKERVRNFEDDLNETGKYQFKLLAGWQDVALPPEKEEDTQEDNRWGGGFGGPRGGMGGRGGMFSMAASIQDWRLLEVLKPK